MEKYLGSSDAAAVSRQSKGLPKHASRRCCDLPSVEATGRWAAAGEDAEEMRVARLTASPG